MTDWPLFVAVWYMLTITLLLAAWVGWQGVRRIWRKGVFTQKGKRKTA